MIFTHSSIEVFTLDIECTFSQLSDTISRNSRLLIVLHSFCYKAILFQKVCYPVLKVRTTITTQEYDIFWHDVCLFAESINFIFEVLFLLSLRLLVQ